MVEELHEVMTMSPVAVFRGRHGLAVAERCVPFLLRRAKEALPHPLTCCSEGNFSQVLCSSSSSSSSSSRIIITIITMITTIST